ncbi:MAG TPA: FrgA protein [Myxococcales bacterium]|nr:FrgA protein [Myxococcales bacterium]
MPTRLAQQLVTKGLLPVERASEALRIQAMTGGALDTVLLELGWVPEQDLLQAMSDASSYRPVNLADFEPNRDVAGLIPPKIAERLCVAPLSTDGPSLHVACGYPVRKAELDEVAFLLGKQLELWVAIEARIRDWIATIYKQPLGARYSALLVNIDPSRPAPPATPAPRPAAPEPPKAAAPAPAPAQAPRPESRPMRATAAPPPTRPPAPELGPEPPTPVEDVIPHQLDDEPPTPPRPPPRPLEPTPAPPPPARPPQPAPPLQLVEETTLEDALTAEMVDRLARSVAEEPIPLDVKKAPRPLDGDPRSARAGLPAEVVSFGRRPVTRPPGPSAEAAPPATQPEPAPDSTDFTLEEPDTDPGLPPRAQPAPEPPPPAPPPPIQLRAPEPVPPAPPPPPAAPPQRLALPALPALPPDQVPAHESLTPPYDSIPQTYESLPQAFETRMPPAQGLLPPEWVPPEHGSATPEWAASHEPAPPPAPEAPPAPPPPDQTAPDWSLQEARAQLKEATVDRDRIVEVALRYGRRTFDAVVAFAVIRGAAVGWDARGDEVDPAQISQVSIPLDSASVFRTVALSRGSYVGPLPPDSLSKHFLELFGRSPRTVFLFPVEVRSRLVAILYGDSGAKPLSQRRLSDYILFCQDLPGAFQELLVRRKQRAGALLLSEEAEPPRPGAARPPSPEAAVPRGLGWSPFAVTTSGGLGRAASVPAPIASERERPPPDFGPLLRRLTGPDATERARAVAELARSPEASSRVLAQSFPGPTAWSRLPVVELPEADELGPIPGALARLGRPAAQALAPLLDAADSDTRYFALLTVGNLPYPELVDGVLRGLFDLDPDISSAARAASTALKRVGRFEMAMKDLRQELASIDAMRRSLAARALGMLHDRDAIDGLINLTGSDDQMCASAAAEALRDITKATFGTSPRQWTRWWAENRSRRRLEWVVAALRHPELEIRISAIEELSRAFNDNLGFSPDGAPPERDAAVRRWEALIHQRGRWERFDL